jgi:MOSC domain-containing protein YiiM
LSTVEHIHIAPAAGSPMQSLDVVRALPGRGLEGDRYAEGRGQWSDTPGTGRDITLVEAEALDDLRAEHRIDLPPGATRRNVTTRGIRLNDLVGRRFYVGPVLCEGMRLCEPCEYMQDLVGRPILKPLVHKAGLRASILSEGEIRVGDPISATDS